jgi:hypothetical protein
MTETVSPSLNDYVRERPVPPGDSEHIEWVRRWNRSYDPVWEAYAEHAITEGASEIRPHEVFSLTTRRANPIALVVELMETVKGVYGLRDLSPEDGYDVEAPNPKTIENAASWVMRMYWNALETGRGWHKPHVTADEDGDVMFEWWNRDRALTIYASEDDVNYIKGWGLDIENDMEDGEASTSEIRRTLWAWLMN